ncbi:hypothetical protein LWI28_023867 [Acer negundo]|uniref:Uncharacterized protein n=1 Tax=Acer negundo TaxID=4023 RepID=A0AAD5JMN8_ACENE|nr:hypothetical protein LWI28_023867 [Acer negundo]
MKVDIISEELIKPSLPTPLVLRSYKLSSFDLLRGPSYISIFLCFPSNDTNNQSSQRVKLLQESLSKTLTQVYPLAGQTIPDIKLGARNNNVVTKIFVFNGEAISKLIAMAKAGGKRQLISDTAIVTAAIWRVLTKIAQARHGKLRPCVATYVLNMRGKTALPLSKNAFGNLCFQSIARFVPSNDQSKVELHDLVSLLRDSVGKAYKDLLKVSNNGDDLFASLIDVMKEVSDEYDNMEGDIYAFSSIVEFTAYELCDFGWVVDKYMCPK